MATITFDTLKFANRLKDAGVPGRQAEAEAEALAEALEVNLKELATKEDIRREADSIRKEISELRKDNERDLRELEMRLTMKLGALMAASIGVVAALVKLL
jgi:hypothetical protein